MRKLPKKSLSAMIALRALPGAPQYVSDKFVIDAAIKDLQIYKEAGVDSVMLENDFDVPYIKPPLPKEAVILYTKIAKMVRKEFKGPIGIQVMEGAHLTALDIAKKVDLDFLRVEAFVFAHVGGAGIIEGCAGELIRKRKELGAEHIKVFTDVKKKHCSHALTMDLEIEDEVKQADFFMSDGIVITSKFSGEEPKKDDFVRVRKVTSLPIIVGSGMTPENIKYFMSLADVFIVGTTFRKDGNFFGDTVPSRVKKFVTAFNKERKKYI